MLPAAPGALPRAALLVLALVAAGCVVPGAQTPEPGGEVVRAAAWAEKALPYGKGHDHFDLRTHAGLSTPNFEVVGWDPLLVGSKGGSTAGGYLCGEVATREDGRTIAVVNSITTDVAFVVVDVTDPAAPATLGEFLLEGGFAYDVALTPDGLHVIVANDPRPEAPAAAGLPTGGLLGPRPTLHAKWRDACSGETRLVGPEQQLPYGPSTLMVGIEDPRNPKLESVVPAPVFGPHSVATAQVDGETFVVSSITNGLHSASYFQIFLVQETPVGAILEHQSTYQTPPVSNDAPVVVVGHVDASIEKHPVTGQTLAYLANWDAGVVVLDITNPRAPVPLSSFSEWSGEGSYPFDESGNLHSTYPLPGLVDGKHYLLAGQEVVTHPPDHPTGWIYVLDATDPTELGLVGKWTLPVDVEWDFLTFSTHYFAVSGGTLFVTMYHGGLWAVDVSTPQRMADPATIGVFLPDRESPRPPPEGGHGVVGAPNVLDVLTLPDGALLVYDSNSGAYVVRFDPTRPMPELRWEG